MAILTSSDVSDNKPELPKREFDLRPFGYDGEVFVRAMTRTEETEATKLGNKGEDADVFIAARSMIDDEGKPVFRETQLRQGFGRLVRAAARISIELSQAEGDEGDAGKGDSGEADST